MANSPVRTPLAQPAPSTLPSFRAALWELVKAMARAAAEEDAK